MRDEEGMLAALVWRNWSVHCAARGGQWETELPRRRHCASGLWGRSCVATKGLETLKMCAEIFVKSV